MGGWIKWGKDLETDPRVLRMARKLEQRYRNDDVTQDRYSGNALPFSTVTLACGALIRMWVYADTHIRSDDVLGIGPDELDQVVGLPGFSQICPPDWLDIIDDENVKLPDYQEHNGVEAKRRAMTQKRVERHRNARVTPASLPDQDRDQDRDQKKNTTAASRPADDPHAEQFQQFKTQYPKRAGSQPWPRARKAINARLKEGHTWEEILAGAQRYAAFCEATGKVGTEMVKQAATFCGPDKCFLEPFDLPTASRGRLGMAQPSPRERFEKTPEEIEEEDRVSRSW